jgi:hypothetical protein
VIYVQRYFVERPSDLRGRGNAAKLATWNYKLADGMVRGQL